MTSEERREARYRRRRELRAARKAEALAACGGSAEAFSLHALVDASRACERGVGWKRGVQGFCLNRVANCAKLSRKLSEGGYRPAKGKRFQVFERGKVRDIYAVPFPDRVVQRALCDCCLAPMAERVLVHDCGASLKGKGTAFARERLARQLREHWVRYGAHGAVALFDVSSFFASMDARMAADKVAAACGDGAAAALASRYLLQGGPGLGLGNQTSQVAALLYLSELDHWACEVARCGAYGRYMDDGYAIFERREDAVAFLNGVERKLAEVGLAPNARKTRVIDVREGFDFLKVHYRLTEHGEVLRQVAASSVKREKRRIRAHARLVAAGEMQLADAATSYASWRGNLLAAGKGTGRYLQRMMDAYFTEYLGMPWRDALICGNDRKEVVP